jgi:hypothetical protein
MSSCTIDGGGTTKKRWMKSDSPAFRAVKDVVLGKNLLRDLQQMALFKHTGMPPK